jgi:predicted dehydrogenase
MSHHMPRRRFLHGAGVGAASFLASRSGLAALGFSSNESLSVACIGTGGRCRSSLLPALKKIAGVRVVGVCDVWDENLANGKALADPGALATKNYRDVLERKDVDAVVIATPDHWHVPLTIEACAAGKDVYVEKPLTHDVSEGAKVIEAQNRYGRVVQVGMQQRSMPHFKKCYDLVRSGAIGKIHKVHLTWNRNNPLMTRKVPAIPPESVDWKMFLGSARDQSFDTYRFRHWRWFWDFGGGILTDLMVHRMDVAHWYCDLGNPALAVTMGDHFAMQGVWETPDTIQTLLRYPEQQVQVHFEGTFVNARYGAKIEFMGTNGTLYLDRGRYEVRPELGKSTYQEWTLGDERRGADFYGKVDGALLHLTDWVQAIRSRKKPSAPAEVGVLAAASAHLGNQAYRRGQAVRWGE